MNSIIGKKAGMTRLFTEDGQTVPVTVIEVTPNRVTQVKTVETDGYSAVQVAVGRQLQQRVNKPIAGIYAKSGVEPGNGLWELRVPEGAETPGVGTEISVDLFAAGQRVDVVGTTIGKGFAGTIKRHHFNSQDATHGNSVSHRVPGSIGQRQTPGRVFPGKKMSGHLGNARRTIPNLEVVRVEPERNLLLVRGAVPGARGGYVMVKATTKKR
jgi:large subunit ribosomal protein L3